MDLGVKILITLFILFITLFGVSYSLDELFSDEKETKFIIIIRKISNVLCYIAFALFIIFILSLPVLLLISVWRS